MKTSYKNRGGPFMWGLISFMYRLLLLSTILTFVLLPRLLQHHHNCNKDNSSSNDRNKCALQSFVRAAPSSPTQRPLDWIRHFDDSVVEQIVLLGSDPTLVDQLAVVAKYQQVYSVMKMDRGYHAIWSFALPANFVPLSLTVTKTSTVLVSGYESTSTPVDDSDHSGHVPRLICILADGPNIKWSYDHQTAAPSLGLPPHGRMTDMVIDEQSNHIFVSGSLGSINPVTGVYHSSIAIWQIDEDTGLVQHTLLSQEEQGLNIGTSIDSRNDVVYVGSRLQYGTTACSNPYTSGGLLSVLEANSSGIYWQSCRGFPSTGYEDNSRGPLVKLRESLVAFVEPTCNATCHIVDVHLSDIAGISHYNLVSLDHTVNSQVSVSAISWITNQELMMIGSFNGSMTILSQIHATSNDEDRDGILVTWIATTPQSNPNAVMFGRHGSDVGSDLIVDSLGRVTVAGYVQSGGVSWGSIDLHLGAQSSFIAQLSDGGVVRPNIVITHSIENNLHLVNSYQYTFSGELQVTNANVTTEAGITINAYAASMKLQNSNVSMFGNSTHKINFNQMTTLVTPFPIMFDCDRFSTISLKDVILPSLKHYTSSVIMVDGGSVELVGVTLESNGPLVTLRDPSSVHMRDSVLRPEYSNLATLSIEFTDDIPPCFISIVKNEFRGPIIVQSVTQAIEKSPSYFEFVENNLFTSLSINITTGMNIEINNNRFNNGYSLSATIAIEENHHCSIESNSFVRIPSPVNIISKHKGSFYIRNNTINSGITYLPDGFFHFHSSGYCDQPIYINDNSFIGESYTSSTNFMELLFDKSCRNSEFKRNTVAPNPVSSTAISVINIAGSITLNYNNFAQSVLVKYNDTYTGKVLNAQFNYWGVDDYDEVKKRFNPISKTTAFFTPFLNSTGEVVTSGTRQFHDGRVVDCSGIRELFPNAPTGVYSIYPACQESLVRCDMETGDALTVVQRRKSGRLNFNVDWNNYYSGFGDPSEEFFAGLQLIGLLGSRNVSISIRLQNYLHLDSLVLRNGWMVIGKEADNYPLSLQIDGALLIDNRQFQALNQPNGSTHCVSAYSGWWFDSPCSNETNLNGLYFDGIHFPGYDYPIMSTEIMITIDQRQRLNLSCLPSSCEGLLATDPDVCYGHGDCMLTGRCKCYPGYGGVNCKDEVWNCFGVNRLSSSVCSGHGSCVSEDVCECFNNYNGSACNSTIKDLVTVRLNNGTVTTYLRHCDDLNITANVTGDNGRNLTFKWSATPVIPQPEDIVQRLNTSLSIPNGDYIVISASLLYHLAQIRVTIFDGIYIVGEDFTIISMSKMTDFSSRIAIEVDDPWIVPANEPLNVYAYLLPNASCLRGAMKNWSIDAFERPFDDRSTADGWTFTITPDHSALPQKFNLILGVPGFTYTKMLTLRTYQSKPMAVIQGGSRLVGTTI